MYTALETSLAINHREACFIYAAGYPDTCVAHVAPLSRARAQDRISFCFPVLRIVGDYVITI